MLTWQNRITCALVRQRDLFGQWSHRSTVIRTSNAYVFHDPLRPIAGVSAAKSENKPGTRNQDDSTYRAQAPVDPDSPLERALQQPGSVIEGRLLMNSAA